jgi:hypothetical protein
MFLVQFRLMYGVFLGLQMKLLKLTQLRGPGFEPRVEVSNLAILALPVELGLMDG